MRPASALCALTLLLLCAEMVFGCQKSATPTAPSNASVPTTAVTVSFGPGESIPAMFEVTVDPVSMSATSRPLIARTSTGFQASQYDLDITKFQKQAQFDVQSVQFTEIGDVEVTFRHAHPWGPVDIAQPPSATNRADLGYTGRLLILADLQPADIPSHTFFTDVKANTELIRGADGYVQPGDLLAKSGFNANCFPYMLLADEAKDNRIGVSNGGIDTGNWDPAVGGWQRSNLGASGDGWTGYDFLHAGQTIENSFVLNAGELTSGPVTLQVALLIKYTEPKGVGGEVGRTLRLPPATVDVLQFAYRAPHAALDQSQVELTGLLQLDSPLGLRRQPTDIIQIDSQTGDAAHFGCDARDWDGLAEVSGGSDLATDPNIGHILPGTTGFPAVAQLSAPQLATVPASIVATGGSSVTGLPSWPMSFEGVLTNELGAGTEGAELRDVPALFRIEDPEVTAPGAVTARFGVDPVSLDASPTRALVGRTFQAITVRVVTPSPSWVNYSIDPDRNGGKGVSVAIVPDADGPGQDRLGIVYGDVASKTFCYAQATSATPVDSTDWRISDIVGTPYISAATQIIYEGLPAFAYYRWRSAKVGLVLARATSKAPAGVADWVHCDVDTQQEAPSSVEAIQAFGLVITAAGLLAIADANLSSSHPRFYYTSVAHPVDETDWKGYPLPVEFGGPASLVATPDGDLWSFVGESGTWQLVVLQALVIPPVSADMWRDRSPAPGALPGFLPQFLSTHYDELNKRFIVVDNYSTMAISEWQSDGRLSWRLNQLSDPYIEYPSIITRADPVLDSRIRCAFENPQGGVRPLIYARGLIETPRRFGDWQRVVVEDDIDQQATDLITYAGRSVIVYRGRGTNAHLRIAFPEQPW